jgi:hypothetical protein
MKSLVLHPDCAAGSIRAIEASIEPTAHGCRATFVAHGDVSRIAVPTLQEPGRFDNLWKTTCFEIFWSHDGTSYRELNLSPSTRWACYDFDSFREGMRDAPAEVAIVSQVCGTSLRLTADIRSTLPLPGTVALNAIIEDEDGVNRFWALAFRPGAPEFHAAECRALGLPAWA